jgi:hypothetical protein
MAGPARRAAASRCVRDRALRGARASPDLADPADQGADRRSRGRHAGRPDARDRRAREGHARHDHHRQPRRRGRAHRRRGGQERRARRLYAAARHCGNHDDVPERVQEARLRPDEGLRSARQRRELRARADDPSSGAGDEPEGVRRLGQDPGPGWREGELRVVRRGNAFALPGRDAEPRCRAEDGPRAVPRVDAGAPGRDGRHRAGLLRHRRRRDHDAADRPHQGARDQRREALAADAERADLRRARLQGRHRERLVRLLRADEDTRADRREACAPSC